MRECRSASSPSFNEEDRAVRVAAAARIARHRRRNHSIGAPTNDIEGHGRPCGKGVDIGAYEFGDCPASTVRFVRGDVDGKGGIDISDPIFLLTYLFIGGKTPDCLDAGDINDDGSLDISDAVYSLTFQFLGGDPPKSPYPECGIKQLINGLDCKSFPGCP